MLRSSTRQNFDGGHNGTASREEIWLGASIPEGYADVTAQVDVKGLDLLNWDSEYGNARTLLDHSKPSGRAVVQDKGESNGSESDCDWVESDTDEQLMLFVPFQSNLKVHSLHITSLPTPSSDDGDSDTPMRPKTIKVYANLTHVPGFEEAEDIPVTQSIVITAQSWDWETGTAKIELQFVKFQNVSSLVVFVYDGDGTRDRVRVDRLRVIGKAEEKRVIGRMQDCKELNNLAVSLSYKYERTGALQDLEEAIRNGQEAVKVAPHGHPSRAMYLSNLSVWLCTRYMRTKALEDLGKAIRNMQEAVEVTSHNDPERSRRLSNLGTWLDFRYKRTGELEDLEEAIRSGQHAVKATPHDHFDRARRLSNLSIWLGSKYGRNGILEDLQEAIRNGQHAVEATPCDHPDWARRLSYLSTWLGFRYKRTGALQDLEEAIHNGQEAVKATPHGYSDRATYLSDLGNKLGLRYQRTEAIGNLEEAIRNGQEAVKATPHGHSDRARILSNLSTWLEVRYKRIGALKDLEEAVSNMQEAVEAIPHDHSDRAAYLSNLGVLLGSKYELTEALGDLEEAICNGVEAVEATSYDHPDRAWRLNNLGALLGSRYKRIGDLKDLRMAIRNGQHAVKATPHDHSDKAMYLNNLSAWMGLNYERTGQLEDLEEAIRNGHEAVKATPHDHLNRASYLNNLGNMLSFRYERTKSFEDLEEAIRNGQEAVKATPHGHPDRALYLNNLGNKLGFRYERVGVLKDLEEAIRNGQEAIKTSPDDHPNRAIYLSNLSAWLGSRYKRTGEFEVLEEAVFYGQKAVETTWPDHPDRAIRLNNLCAWLGSKYERTGVLEDLQEAIRNGQDAVEATPHDHFDRARRLNNLGSRLSARYKRTGALEDLEKAKALYIISTEMANAPPFIRIEAAQNAGRICVHGSGWAEASSFFEAAVKLLPRVSPRALAQDDQQYNLRQLSGLSSLAASAALQAKRAPSEALALLEAGRGVMAGLAIDSRSEVSDLKKHQVLYDQYIKLRNAISSPMPTVDTRSEIAKASRVAVISRHNKDVQELELVEEQIRKLPGFERFQMPPSPDDFKNLAKFGPIVSFNVTEYRSDAFLVTKTDIRTIQLPELNHDDIKANVELLIGKEKITSGKLSTECSRNEKLREVLKWLWDVAVAPVLRELNLMSATKPTTLPRIWWVTSGLMGLVPLHAAGHLWGVSTENTSSHVVSTYIPTFKALTYARERNLKPLTQVDQRILIVAMSETPGMEDLEVEEEVFAIQESLANPKPQILFTPSKREVLEELQVSSVSHFACHGISDSKDPSNGGLFFKGPNGNADCLTVRELASISLGHAQIAYLSACLTAENSAQDLMDESIHVASSFHLIGFPHVVGTMWEASNDAAVEVARTFYRVLIKRMAEDNGHDAVAYALHNAVIALRKDAVAYPTDDVITWAPFIHIGA